jgi:hypothetical protein
VNNFVRETNLIYRRESPRFSLDFENCRRDRYKKPRYTFKIEYGGSSNKTCSTVGNPLRKV